MARTVTALPDTVRPSLGVEIQTLRFDGALTDISRVSFPVRPLLSVTCNVAS